MSTQDLFDLGLDPDTAAPGEGEGPEKQDFDGWFGVEIVEEEEDDALRRLTRRIAGQYGEVLIHFAERAYAEPDVRDLAQSMRPTLDNLVRLAQSSGHTGQVDLLRELDEVIEKLAVGTARSRARTQALSTLREWLPRFAETLLPEDAARVKALVELPTAPLIGEFRAIPGIGEARLKRLYSAGLLTLGSVANANPVDVSEVTGIPLGVCEQVVASARDYAARERSRCLTDVAQRAMRLQAILDAVELADDPELASAARKAIQQLEHALSRLEHKS